MKAGTPIGSKAGPKLLRLGDYVIRKDNVWFYTSYHPHGADPVIMIATNEEPITIPYDDEQSFKKDLEFLDKEFDRAL